MLCLLILAEVATAQSSSAAARRRQQQQMQQQMKKMAENQPKLPADPQLLTLHREFITKAEKLGAEYERKKQLDKAREVYESMVRLVPNYQAAEEGLSRVLGGQRFQDRKLVNVDATKLWQDTGIVLKQGMPVHVEIKGTWKVVYETGPKGIEIPDKLRPKDNRIKLGTLIAVVVNNPSELTDANPFILEHGKDFNARKTGRLFLRMYDVDPTDNEGNLYVLIQSTFAN